MSWPAVSSKRGLRRRELKGIHLFTIDDVLSTAEADAFVAAAEKLGFQHHGSLGPSKGEAFRDNDRISLHSQALADQLWNAGLAALFDGIESNGRIATGLNPNIRFYRYNQGQRFGQHVDESVEIDADHATEYTLLIYLNSGMAIKSKKGARDSQLVGGETVFYTGRNKAIGVVPVSGMALLHLHGDECMLHEAKTVRRGVKYVLRSDVVFSKRRE
ncbi:uncharacterized protein LOC9630609 [Selaginella moellendorffii]|uniref:uncharacterized protein LOC9630609 n=1 Tax=Selaginella moellendorffii TaxID=88036 RepID=UPI000D1C4F0F|nr:uncharacterized protein LOC9630609 [Selaginella moellendorffii]|eukprot:XP_024536364.1 uncharacterized protein LOC9630609 [Selaginella moellendorffii]